MISLSVDGLIVVLLWGMTTTARMNARFTAVEEPGMQNLFSLILTNLGNKCSCSFQNNTKNNKKRKRQRTSELIVDRLKK
jgi:hypothetical protein